MKLKTKKEDGGQRIDKFLTNNLSDSSRSQIQKLFKKDCITVNEKATTKHYKLKENDVINIKKIKSEKQKIKVVTNTELQVAGLKLKIIFDTPEYLIVNKPAGLIMHGAEHIQEITLVDLILKKYPKIKKIGEDPIRPGIVHRIDKDVSGLVVVAKTQDFFDNLKKQFQERTVKKEYTALVYEKIEKESDEINFPISRSSSGYKMAAHPFTIKGDENTEAKRAITQFEVITRFINYTLVKVNIKTGRTHQIRVHMAAYGHPIVGDDLYSTKRTREQNKKLNLGRVFLFANKLFFKDLSGEKQSFKVDMPDELKIFLDKVK